MEIPYILTRPGPRPRPTPPPGAAAADLCAALDAPLTLAPGQRAIIPTGVAVQLPGPQWVALLCARSGLAVKRGLTLSNGVGVIDSDYRGEIGAGVVNLGEEPVTVEPASGWPADDPAGGPGHLRAGRNAGRYPPGRGGLWLHRPPVSRGKGENDP